MAERKDLVETHQFASLIVNSLFRSFTEALVEFAGW